MLRVELRESSLSRTLLGVGESRVSASALPSSGFARLGGVALPLPPLPLHLRRHLDPNATRSPPALRL